MLKSLPPLSLYIHMPWCIKKCPYCDFNSHTLNSSLPEEEYIDALMNDLESSLPLFWGRSITSVFIGGGTPSLFSAQAIDRLLSGVRRLTMLSPYAEITIEANPGVIDDDNVAGYAKAGVNRISFGAQSFNDEMLKNIGRIHNKAEVVRSINLAKNYFKRINLDLIYGLPGQTLEMALTDLQEAIALEVEHLSYYQLTLEPNTAFATKPPPNLPSDDNYYLMQEQGLNFLTTNGYSRYEISAFCRDNNVAKHNVNYWQFGDYLGIGAGAHSKISFHDKIIRQVRQKHPKTYLQQLSKYRNDRHNKQDKDQQAGIAKHIIEDREVSKNELPFEFMLNAVRMIGGFQTSLFTLRTGLSLNVILPKLLKCQQLGFLTLTGEYVKLTKKGCDFQNELLIEFMED